MLRIRSCERSSLSNWSGLLGNNKIQVFLKRKSFSIEIVFKRTHEVHARTHARTHVHTQRHLHTHTHEHTDYAFSHNLKRAANIDLRHVKAAAWNGKHDRSTVLGKSCACFTCYIPPHCQPPPPPSPVVQRHISLVQLENSCENTKQDKKRNLCNTVAYDKTVIMKDQ